DRGIPVPLAQREVIHSEHAGTRGRRQRQTQQDAQGGVPGDAYGQRAGGRRVRGPPRRPGWPGGTCAAGNAPARRGSARGTSGGSRASGTPAGGIRTTTVTRLASTGTLATIRS